MQPKGPVITALRRSRRPSRLLALVAVAAAALVAVEPSQAAEPGSPVEELGILPLPPTAFSNLRIAAVDSERGRLYATFATRVVDTVRGATTHTETTGWLATYELGPAVPTLLKVQRIDGVGDPNGTPLTSFLEPSRGRLFFLGGGLTSHDGSIVAVDVGDGVVKGNWAMADHLPGFYPAGMTYSKADDRIYAVGEMTVVFEGVHATPTFGRKPAGVLPTVAAFDPDDGALLWARPVPECGQVLYSFGVGSIVVRDNPTPSTPRLLFVCGTGSSGFGDTMPGQAGIAELHVTPDATAVDAAGFDLSFHPISGSFFDGGKSGFAAYDYGSHRLFVQSLSQTTPGAWVFDARRRGWVGSIPSKEPTNYFGGVDQATGRYYMGGSTGNRTGFLIVADGRATPPQNGVLAPPKYSPDGFIATDPATGRLFVPRGPVLGPYVLRDLTRSAPPQAPPDYDAQTDDVDEAPGTFVSFTGDGGGFGARVTAVGDTAAIFGTVPIVKLPVDRTTRGVVLARVAGASVQPAGAAASAQAAGLDTTTDRELEQTQAPVATPRPTGPVSCLDGGGGVDSAPVESAGGKAEVRCVLANYESSASARQTAADLGAVSVGDSRFDTKVRRSAKGGMVTTSTAVATGIRVEVPGVGLLRIGRVETTVRTAAHGRSGTAAAEWTRNIGDVVVEDGAGHELFGTAGCSTTITHDGKKETRSGDAGTCDQMADTIRRLLQVRVRLVFPTPEVVATPKGAFARVGQSDSDAAHEVTVNEQGKVFDGDTTTRRSLPGLQVNVYNDSTERSRYVVQLAAVESSAIYTVNSSPDEPPCDTGGCIPGGFDEPPSGDDISGVDARSSDMSTELAAGLTDGSAPAELTSLPATGRRPNRSVQDNGLRGLVVSRRDLGDGALMASFLTLVGAAVALVARRRRLVGLVG